MLLREMVKLLRAVSKCEGTVGKATFLQNLDEGVRAHWVKMLEGELVKQLTCMVKMLERICKATYLRGPVAEATLPPEQATSDSVATGKEGITLSTDHVRSHHGLGKGGISWSGLTTKLEHAISKAAYCLGQGARE